MKTKKLKTIEWRPDLMEKATKEIYVRADLCCDAGLYKLEDGRVIYHAYWLTNHGIGPDHCSILLENIADLREALEQDVEYGNISKEELKK